MRALVTGAGGFLGSHICRQLVERGTEVRGLSRRRYDTLDHLGVEQLSGDIRDPDAVLRACRDVDGVFHTAAIAGIWGKRETFESINYRGTLNVIDACRNAGVGRLVFSSSPSVTFDGRDQCLVDESVPYPDQWLCDYPRTKAMAEQAVLQSNAPELMTCALRPHLIWGPGDPHLVPRLLDRASRGRLRQIGDGTNLIDIIFVDNAAAAHLAAMDRLVPDSPVCGSAYFLSQGEPVNCWDWIREVLSMRQIRLPGRSLSFRQAWWLGAACESIYGAMRWTDEPPMTRFVAAQLAKSHFFDIGRARRDLGYEPGVATDEGLRRLAKSLANE